MIDVAKPVMVPGAETVIWNAGDSAGATGMVVNRTATASVFVHRPGKLGNAADGFEWKATDPPLSLNLDSNDVLVGRLAAGQPQQQLEVLVATETR